MPKAFVFSVGYLEGRRGQSRQARQQAEAQLVQVKNKLESAERRLRRVVLNLKLAGVPVPAVAPPRPVAEDAPATASQDDDDGDDPGTDNPDEDEDDED